MQRRSYPSTLEPSVLGKTVTFSYKGLDYATAYTFTLEYNKAIEEARSIEDVDDIVLVQAIRVAHHLGIKLAKEDEVVEEMGWRGIVP